jgi:hypothetical protein
LREWHLLASHTPPHGFAEGDIKVVAQSQLEVDLAPFRTQSGVIIVAGAGAGAVAVAFAFAFGLEGVLPVK